MTVLFLYRATNKCGLFWYRETILEYKSWFAMIIVHETGLRCTNNG